MSGRTTSRHFRSIALRTTARAGFFFDTTQAVFELALCGRGKTVSEKYVPCTRRDFTRFRVVKSERESRYFFGITPKAAPAPSGGGGEERFGRKRSRCARGIRASSLAYASSAATFVSSRYYTRFFD